MLCSCAAVVRYGFNLGEGQQKNAYGYEYQGDITRAPGRTHSIAAKPEDTIDVL
jgi:hypothetical protein